MGACHSVDKEEDGRRGGDMFGAELDLHDGKLTAHQTRLIKRHLQSRQRPSVEQHHQTMAGPLGSVHPYAMQYNTVDSMERAIERRIANSPPIHSFREASA